MKRTLCLLLSLILCMSLFPGFGSAAFAEESKDYSAGSPWVCSNILSNVQNSEETDVKDNFDLAVNGQWVSDNPIPSGEVRKVFLLSFKDKLNERLYGILEDDSYENNKNADLVQTFYNAFLDWDARNAAGAEPLMPYLQEIEEISTIDDFADYAARKEVSLAGIFYYDIVASPEDSSRKILSLGSPATFLTDVADYADLDNMSDYTKLTYDCAREAVSTVLSKCGYSEDEISRIFDGAIEFEALIAPCCYTYDEWNLTATDDTVNAQLFTPEELSGYQWFQTFSALLANFGVTDFPTVKLSEKMDYFENLDDFLCEENLELIKDYLLAHTAYAAITVLDEDCFYAGLDISNELNGSDGYKDEKEYALEAVENSLGWTLSRLYCDKYVTEEDKQTVYDLVLEIVDGYQEMLQSEDFLSDATKAEAISKLDNMVIQCMYPDDWSKYDYSALEMSGDYFNAVIDISMFSMEKAFDEFKDPISRDEWGLTPITLNAAYFPGKNCITIMCGLVGDVLYRPDMLKEELYAKLGAVIGHEISHAFDPSGSTYDAEGNYKDWWTEEDKANFQALTDKLVAYYDNISIWDGLNCSGELVKGEACADMGGVAVMLRLAKADPNFDYDLFFRSYAELWATNITPNFAAYSALYNPHPLNYLRTNVTLAQFDEFYETYDVQEGDGMYIAPEDRVKIW